MSPESQRPITLILFQGKLKPKKISISFYWCKTCFWHISQTNETVKNVYEPDKCLLIIELLFYFLNGFISSFSFSPAEFFIDLCYLCFSSFCPCHDIFTSRLNCLATMHLEMKLKEYNLHMEYLVHEWRSILVRKQTQNRYLNKWFLMKKRIPW